MFSPLKKSILAAALAALGGCFTISQTDYPAVQASRVSGDVKVRLEGFAATSLAYVPAWTRSGYWPVWQATDAYRIRATDLLERAGCVLRASPADYSVAVDFMGPVSHPDAGWHVFETLGTLTFLFRGGSVYAAQLKIYETKSGKCVFAHDYEQPYEAHGWSLIPIFGVLDWDKIQEEYVKCWCLNALTDRCCCDAAAFLASAKSKRSGANP